MKIDKDVMSRLKLKDKSYNPKKENAGPNGGECKDEAKSRS